MQRNGQPRIVVTGLGVISPVGIGIDHYWNALKSGESGIREITHFDTSSLNVQIAGQVPDFVPEDYLDKKQIRRMERSSQFAVAAARMAITDAGLTVDELEANSERTGVVIGTAFAGFDAARRGLLDVWVHKRKPGPYAIVSSLTNMPVFHVAYAARATGPSNALTTACAASTQAIGEGSELIRRGVADMVFTGGVEAVVQEYTLAGFDAMTTLARHFNDRPAEASRPFDADRAGFVLSEGGAILILESLEHAMQRGAKIYAEVKGHAASNDAYHLVAIDPEGKGAQRAMRWALEDAQVAPEQVDYINAHGTATRANDALETHAIKEVLGDHAYATPISSTKSMIGHVLGGAGALEAIACIMTLQDQVIHPTINYTTPDPKCDLDYVPNTARDASVNIVMSNNFGLGGQNASLVLARV
ncbi:MAG: beta-ketoacyl-ACP synthase II [Chloroflexi bacterium]|nr:beta-ketoacyl-ACP synthase II [Chloroflexota bacterium]